MPKNVVNPQHRFDPDDTAAFTMNMPKRLRKRFGDLAKAMRLSNSAFVILALTAFVEQIEAKQRAEEEREAREKREKLERRRYAPLAPEVLERLSVDDPARAPVGDDADDASLYEQHAKRIAEVLHGDPRELRLRRDEAVAAIRRQFPLTHPPEPEMLAKLERLVKKQPQPKQPATPPVTDDDPLVEPIIAIKESP